MALPYCLLALSRLEPPLDQPKLPGDDWRLNMPNEYDTIYPYVCNQNGDRIYNVEKVIQSGRSSLQRKVIPLQQFIRM